KELDSWIDDHEYLVTKDVYIHIKEKYGVDYSLKQVREIIKKLDYSWAKPYTLGSKMPSNAEEILKSKTKDIDPDEDIYGFVDEVAVQNTPNVGRIIKKKLKKDM
ncbi:MAG: winged helix-turn-helix domain-containing protein, partial [Methanobrevibacter sp.]|nr:winged helix-turn-helix domain-containing protein [Candidatus Methanoflexus mossambicus]